MNNQRQPIDIPTTTQPHTKEQPNKYQRHTKENRRKVKNGIQNHRFWPKVESKTPIFSKKWNSEALWGVNQIIILALKNHIFLSHNHLQPQKSNSKITVIFSMNISIYFSTNDKDKGKGNRVKGDLQL